MAICRLAIFLLEAWLILPVTCKLFGELHSQKESKAKGKRDGIFSAHTRAPGLHPPARREILAFVQDWATMPTSPASPAANLLLVTYKYILIILPIKIYSIHESSPAMAVDRLSGLPDDLLRRILYFAPAREGASTAVLSWRWPGLWATSGAVTLTY